MRSGDIAARLGRSEKSIADRLGRKLGLRRWITKPFSKAEDKVILSGRGKTIREIARKLGRAPAVISSRAKRLGIKSWMEFAGTYKEFGRDLLRVERVHHINGKKRDNRPRNLHLFPNTAAHSKAHHSITRLLSVLLERRILRFDRNEGIYKLCAIRN
jgi:DNA-binding CsgD family transcriptional regulator